MKKIILILFTFHVSLLTLTAQPSITWQRTYGGYPGWDDYASSVVQTPDNGYILTGQIDFNQMFIMRLNQFGDTLWTKRYPWGRGIKIERTIDNNYIVCGEFTRVIKIDINGNTIWSGGPYDINAGIASIKQTPEGGYILCGARDQSIATWAPYLLKIDSNGILEWDTSYTNGIFDGGFQEIVLAANDNSYVLTGNFSDTNYITDKLFIMKTDFIGNRIWFRGYDTLWYYYATSMVKDGHGNFIIGGACYSPFVTKMDSNGFMQWFKFIQFFYPEQSICWSLTNTFDGGYALTGTWDSSDNARAFLVKTDSLGSGLWYKTYGLNDAVGIGIKQTSDSGYVIAGDMNIDFWDADIYVVKTDKTGFANPIRVKPISHQVPINFKLYQNYPNPFNPDTKIKFDIPVPLNKGGERGLSVQLKIYDILGKEVATLVNEQLRPGTYEVNWKGSNYPSGIYFYKLITQEFSQSRKMILVK